MLKELRISNLVLVESAELHFNSGLTAITGETGAGKTILLEALKLAAGRRADTDAVRRGAPKATVEAAFDIKDYPEVARLLEEAGLTWSESEPLLLKREISGEGRSRAFINCQMVPLSLLQAIGERLVDFTDQHAHHSLRNEDAQRAALDLYGGLRDLSEEVERAKRHVGITKKNLEILRQTLLTAQKERELAAFELEELNSAALKEDEEEGLAAEHHRLAHVQEIGTKIGALCALLEDPPYTLIAQLKRSYPLLKSACALDAKLGETEQLLAQGIVALEEVRHQLQTYLGRLENDPKRLSFIEERLALYHKFRRKYSDPYAYKKSLTEKLGNLGSIEEEILAATLVKDEAESRLHTLREQLTKGREKAALTLSVALTDILHTLHMPHAEVAIEVTAGENPLEGDDSIEFFLHANRGEKRALVKEHASGGELSRLCLALQTALAQHHATPVLVFDEIDANVGGQTASAIAEKLAMIAEHCQVLCVTHFPQVAKRCHHHVRIFKEESEGRTLTHLENLDPRKREKEFLRMLG